MYVAMVRIQYRVNASSPPIGFGKDIFPGGVGTFRVVLVKEEVQSQVEVLSLYGQTCVHVCVCMCVYVCVCLYVRVCVQTLNFIFLIKLFLSLRPKIVSVAFF